MAVVFPCKPRVPGRAGQGSAHTRMRSCMGECAVSTARGPCPLNPTDQSRQALECDLYLSSAAPIDVCQVPGGKIDWDWWKGGGAVPRQELQHPEFPEPAQV